MNIRGLIQQYLVDNGYDGLVSENGECGCIVENLFPCDSPDGRCCPAYNHGSKNIFRMSEEAPLAAAQTSQDLETPLELANV